MNVDELLAVPVEDAVRAQRRISLVTAALADLQPLPEWPDMIATRCDEPLVVGYACQVAQQVARPKRLPVLVLRDGAKGQAAERWNEFVQSLTGPEMELVDRHEGVRIVVPDDRSSNSVEDASIAIKTAVGIGAKQILFVFSGAAAARGTLTTIRQHERLASMREAVAEMQIDFAIAQRPYRQSYPIPLPEVDRLFGLEAIKMAAYLKKGDVATLDDFEAWLDQRRQR